MKMKARTGAVLSSCVQGWWVALAAVFRLTNPMDQTTSEDSSFLLSGARPGVNCGAKNVMLKLLSNGHIESIQLEFSTDE